VWDPKSRECFLIGETTMPGKAEWTDADGSISLGDSPSTNTLYARHTE
jgi:hypothetical protein